MRSHLRWGAARHYISRKNDELVEREQESKSTLQPEDSDWMLKKKKKRCFQKALCLEFLDPRQLVFSFLFLVQDTVMRFMWQQISSINKKMRRGSEGAGCSSEITVCLM